MLDPVGADDARVLEGVGQVGALEGLVRSGRTRADAPTLLPPRRPTMFTDDAARLLGDVGGAAGGDGDRRRSRRSRSSTAERPSPPRDR
ncbi:MAG: hypothetical protein MZV64_11150 [Ignavibacteriales bacterium]|nr:hypothetical protein [Ignavibacteriales bacterium]